MTSLEFPEVPTEWTDLEPLEPVKGRGGAPSARVGIGGPLWRPYGPDDETDEEMRSFMQADAGRWAYHLLQLRCTLDAAEDEPFEQLLVQVDLARSDGARDDPPIGWEAVPEVATVDQGTIRRTIEVPAKIKLLGTEIGPDVKIETERRTEDTYAQVFGLLTATPKWRLWAVRNRPLTEEKLTLVIRSPLAPTVATFDATATIRRRIAGIVPYHVELPPARKSITLTPPNLSGDSA